MAYLTLAPLCRGTSGSIYTVFFKYNKQYSNRKQKFQDFWNVDLLNRHAKLNIDWIRWKSMKRLSTIIKIKIKLGSQTFDYSFECFDIYSYTCIAHPSIKLQKYITAIKKHVLSNLLFRHSELALNYIIIMGAWMKWKLGVTCSPINYNVLR